ncbi:MAG: hypothetical protein Q9183_007321, partial [Haloplaca sp. 2 TL-2023]
MDSCYAPPTKPSISPSTSSVSSPPPPTTNPSGGGNSVANNSKTIPSKLKKTTVLPPTSTIRIRDNQRRSRARRKEYILELETKVRGYEHQGVEVAAEIQAAARRVVEMNRHLREEVEMLRGMLAEQTKGNGVKGPDAMDATVSTAAEKNVVPKGHNSNNNIYERRRKS